MKRFRAASLLLLALSIIVIGFEAPSAQAVLCNDGSTQSNCEKNGGPAPTAPAAPSPPPGGCGINTSWNGNSCAPNITIPTATASPTPSPTGCGANLIWDGLKCVENRSGQPATIKCADGTFRVTAIECPQGTNTGIQSGTTCNANEVSIGGKCVSNTSLPICTAAQSTNCIPDTTTSTKVSCPTVGQLRDAGGNCFTPTATTQTATIKCSDGTFRVTAIECGQGSSGSISGSGTQGQVIQCNDGTGQVSCEKNGGIKTFSSDQMSGTVQKTLTIKCSDGSLRATVTECEQSVGGKSTVAITCPSNQVVAPSGAYCIYPTTTGTAQGTYRSECAVTPVPASCLVGATTTFEKSTQMAQVTTFNTIATQELKIQGNNAFNSAGEKIGELAKASNGQVYQAAPPPPPSSSSSSSSSSGKAATKKPAKTSSAPVIVMNVLGADNKEILGPDGKPLQTAPIVKSGNFVFTDRNGNPIMATPTLNAAGEAVVHNGKVLMTRLMTIGGNEAMIDASGKPIMMIPLLGEDGKPLLASNGEVLYSPPMVNAEGKTITSSATGQPTLAKPMADSSGNAALGADKKPFMGQPLLTKDNKLLTVGGQEIYTGAVGMPLTNSKKQQVQTANKQDVQFGFGGTLIDEGGNAVLGPDGKAIVMNANATPLMSNGLPLLDKNGKAVRVNANGQVTDSSGRTILGIDGKAIAIGKSESADVMKVGSVLKSTVKAPDGSVAVMALNAQLFDKSGNPIVTATGQPIFFDAKSKKLIDPKGNAVKVEAGGKIVGKISSLAFQTVNFAA